MSKQETTKRLGVVLAMLLFAFGALAAEPEETTAAAKETKETATAPAPAATETNADDIGLAHVLPSKLQVHGYLSQAYARADQHQIAGIPTSGTSDYREAALQFRYTMTTKDTFVLQFEHERMGNSRLEMEEVGLDWGFYQREIGDNTNVRIGRVQIPFGIYNEIRDAGTILPFYRLPTNYYGQQSYASETVDGASVTHRFAPASPWNLQASAYFGGWDVIEVREEARTTKISNAAGVQLWLGTPIDGLRFGVGGNRATAREGWLPEGASEWRQVMQGSIDGNFARFITRAEYRHAKTESSVQERAYMVQLGYRIVPKVMVVVQQDANRVHMPPFGEFASLQDTTVGRDRALAVNYFFRPDLVLKVEAHQNRSLSIEDAPAVWQSVAPKADYWVVSLSTSF